MDEAPKTLTMTVREAADQLNIGINQAYAAVHSGQLPAVKIGKRILIVRAAFERKFG